MKRIIVWDLDGTLADGRHRLNLLPQEADKGNTKSWDSFNLAAGLDVAFNDNIELMNTMYKAGYQNIIVTGRSAIAQELTLAWLDRNFVAYDELHMRPVDDHRPDVEFKEEVLRKIGLSRILCAFDDLEHMAKHIRSLGVTCHLVTHYDTPKLHERDHRTEQCEHDWDKEHWFDHQGMKQQSRSFCRKCNKTKEHTS